MNKDQCDICVKFSSRIQEDDPLLFRDFSAPEPVSSAIPLSGETGSISRCRVENAAELSIEKEESILILTLWPNFFTDSIGVYKQQSFGVYPSNFMPFHSAAQLNRTLVARSLKEIELATGGVLNWWGSKLVNGITRYGFEDSATPIGHPMLKGIVCDSEICQHQHPRRRCNRGSS